MGNICSGSSDEDKKPSLLQPPSESETAINGSDNLNNQGTSQSSAFNDASINNISNNNSLLNQQQSPEDIDQLQEEQKKQLEARRLEQARLDMIVQAAGRRMVAVRSTRGSNAYYDQGFAAALSQHLEQTTKFQEHVDRPLPPAHATSVYERLSQPAWDGIMLGIKDGAAGLAGESPNAFFDRVVAEPLLQQAVPKQERLFAGVEPMVESLL